MHVCVFPTQPSIQLLDQLTDFQETCSEYCPWKHVDCLHSCNTGIPLLTVSSNIVAGVGTCEAEMEHYEQACVLLVYLHHQQQ